MNWINLRADKEDAARILRILILVVFPLAVLATVFHLLSMHIGALMPLMHLSHTLHVILISATFLFLAIYLYLSAYIASERRYRELFIRMTVDPTVSYIRDIPTAEPIFNTFAGILANKGIVVHSPSALKAVAYCSTVYIEGNSSSRAGYEKTVSTFRKMGVFLSDSSADCPVRIVLGPYDHSRQADIVVTENRIAHVLFAVYVSRLYVRYRRWLYVLLMIACLAAVCVALLGLYPYVFAAFAVWGGIYILLIRRGEKATAKPTFAMMETSRPLK